MKITEGQLIVSDEGNMWGRVNKVWMSSHWNADGTEAEFADISFWLSAPNFRAWAPTATFAVVEEGSYEHRLMILAEKLVLVAGHYAKDQLNILDDLIQSIPANAKQGDYLNVARRIKYELVGRMRDLPTIPAITKLIKEFVAETAR